MTETRNILLIGRTGSGKSSLANILVNEVDEEGNFRNFKEVFEEGNSMSGITKEVKSEKFMKDNIEYRVIDTVGIGDPGLKVGEIIKRLLEAVTNQKDGINQIIFVFENRFEKIHLTTLNLFKKIILDERATNYITLVRTRFDLFLDQDEQRKDLDDYLKGNEKELTETIDYYDKKNKIIYVNNPSLNTTDERLIGPYSEIKKDSRKILLDHLSTCRETYRPKEDIEEILRRINSMGLNELVLEDVIRIYKGLHEDVNKSYKKIDEFIKSRKETIESIKSNIVDLPSLISKFEHAKSLGIDLALDFVTNNGGKLLGITVVSAGSIGIMSFHPEVREVAVKLIAKLTSVAKSARSFIAKNSTKINVGIIATFLAAKISATGAQVYFERKYYNKIMEIIDKDKRLRDNVLSQYKNQKMKDELGDYKADELDLPEFLSLEMVKRTCSFELSQLSSLYSKVCKLSNKIKIACKHLASNAFREVDGRMVFDFSSLINSFSELGKVLKLISSTDSQESTSEVISELIVKEMKRYIEYLEREETSLSETSNNHKKLDKALKDAIQDLEEEIRENVIGDERNSLGEERTQSLMS